MANHIFTYFSQSFEEIALANISRSMILMFIPSKVLAQYCNISIPFFTLGKQNFVFQTPNGLGNGRGYGGYGYGGFGPWGHGYGNLGHIHPVPVTGVKALSVAYDQISGVPYICDPNKKPDAAAGGAKPAGPAPPATGKRSHVEKDEEKKDEIKVKIPDYPPCPDPKKSFPWSCICKYNASTPAVKKLKCWLEDLVVEQDYC